MRARVIAGRAAYPVKDIRIRDLVDGRNIQSLGPLHALFARGSPRIAGPFHATESALQLCRKASLGHHQVAPNVDNVEHLLILRRAHLHARAAGGAGPYRFLGDHSLQQTGTTGVSLLPCGCTHNGKGTHLARDGVQHHALVNFQRGRTERLACLRGGTHILAAIALNTRIGVQEARPGKVREPRGADLRLGDFKINFAGGQFTAACIAPEKVFEWRHEEVNVLAVGEIQKEEQNAAQGSPIACNTPGHGMPRKQGR